MLPENCKCNYELQMEGVTKSCSAVKGNYMANSAKKYHPEALPVNS